MKDTFTQFVRLGMIILLVGVGLYGLDALYFAPDRLPACVQDKLPEGRLCLEFLLSSKKSGRQPGKYDVVWVDARSESDYELNHLMMPDERVFPIRPGAAMPQLMDAAIERLMEADERGEWVVVFCTSDCNASSEIADALRQTGLIKAPIYVLEGGWPALKRSGLVKD